MGEPEYAPGSAIALLRQESEPSPILQNFGMYSYEGNNEVGWFVKRWTTSVLPEAMRAPKEAEQFAYEPFRRHLLSIHLHYPEVLDTSVREAIFERWDATLSSSNAVEILRSSFDAVYWEKFEHLNEAFHLTQLKQYAHDPLKFDQLYPGVRQKIEMKYVMLERTVSLDEARAMYPSA
jgi:hypothetical protein